MEERIVRRTKVAGSLMAVMLMAVACSSGGSSASPEASTPASAPPASAGAGESAAASASGGGQLGGSVSVIGTWTGAEQESFMAMVKPWEDQTGAKVQYTGTRDINNILSTGIQSGLLPDLAGLPGPGQMAEYVKAGALKPLNDVIDMTAYTADTAPGPRDPRHGERPALRHLHQGRHQGAVLVQHRRLQGRRAGHLRRPARERQDHR